MQRGAKAEQAGRRPKRTEAEKLIGRIGMRMPGLELARQAGALTNGTDRRVEADKAHP